MGVRSFTPADVDAVARLLAGQNRTATRRCLHSEESNPDAMARVLREHLDEADLVGVVDEVDGRIRAALVAEYDDELRRLWLWGPAASEASESGWVSAVADLHGALTAEVSFDPVQRDAFLDREFEWAASWYRDLGYVHAKTAHVFVARRSEVTPSREVVDVPDAAADEFRALFDHRFPGTYYTADQVLDRRTADERVLACLDGERLLGFCHASADEAANEGSIEFIATAEGQEGRGVGSSLLAAALRWLLGERGLAQVGLVTEEDNQRAQRIYRRAGFEHHRTGHAWRWTDEAP